MDEGTVARLVAAVAGATTVLQPPGQADMLQDLVDTARELFAAAACSVAVVDPAHEDRLIYRVASGAGADGVVGLVLPLGRGIAGWVASSGASIAVEDVTSDPRWDRDLAERTGYLPRSILATPVETRRSVLGVLSVLDRRPPADAAQAQRDMSILGLLAKQVALALETAELFDDAGRVLVEALAATAGDQDVLSALADAARARTVRSDLALLTRMFARLQEADPQLGRLAAETVERFAVLAERRSPW